MNKTDKALKRRLRGVKKLQEALDYLGWSRWTPPGEDEIEVYVVGKRDAVTYVADIVLVDIALEPEEESNANVPSEVPQVSEGS